MNGRRDLLHTGQVLFCSSHPFKHSLWYKWQFPSFALKNLHSSVKSESKQMEQVVSVVETILRISKKLLSNDSSQSSMNISLKRDDNSSYSFGSRSFILVAINSNLKGRYFFSFFFCFDYYYYFPYLF